jgi:hypothetical protein
MNPRPRKLAAFFEVTETRVEHFFHAAKLGAPQVSHVVEAAVDGVETRGDMGGKQAEHCGVEQHRDADCKIELFVGHHS